MSLLSHILSHNMDGGLSQYLATHALQLKDRGPACSLQSVRTNYLVIKVHSIINNGQLEKLANFNKLLALLLDTQLDF